MFGPTNEVVPSKTGKVFTYRRTYLEWAVGYYKHPSIVEVPGL